MKTLTARDREIVYALIFRVGVFTARQVVRHWWPHTGAGRKNGTRRLRLLCERRLLRSKPLHVKAIEGVELIGQGYPEGPHADAALLSNESRRRWQLPIRRESVVIATERARRIFGGPSENSFRSLHGLNHSIGVSELYLHLCRTRPDLAERWIGEHEFDSPAFREAQPDALIAGPSGEPECALEFASDYSRDRFQRLASTLAAKQLPYKVFAAA